MISNKALFINELCSYFWHCKLTLLVILFFTAATAFISHLLYYGYENELPFDVSNQVALEHGSDLKEIETKYDITNYLREIRVDNAASGNPIYAEKKGM